MKMIMLLSIFLPMIVGAILPFTDLKERQNKLTIVLVTLIVELIFGLSLIFKQTETFRLFEMSDVLFVDLKVDSVSKLFILIDVVAFLLAGIFSFKYMEHETNTFKEEIFYGFFLLTLGALVGMAQANNLIAMYFFFELITIMSMPLVLFEKTKESINAALKYLFYSIAGAFCALFCIFVLIAYSSSTNFVAGGGLINDLGNKTLLLSAILVGVIGFGAKAGMFPLHSWLATAHPVAPAPASAVLSGIITKAGVLAIIRIIYYIVGVNYLANTWVQNVLLGLSLLTVFMGSMLAYRENILKKRLAYSSVSQISYVLFGLFLLNSVALKGALMQIIFHATVKICLFLFAGSIIFNTHMTNVDDLMGFGKSMPKTFMAFTFASLSLIGIPPFAGFVSKWYLAQGALISNIRIYNYLGPIILLISALLTAGYLLPITIKGFFPGVNFKEKKTYNEGGICMLLPIIVLAGASLLLGIFAGYISPLFDLIVEVIF